MWSLTLIRHGKAERGSTAGDHERDLRGSGRREVRAMGERLCTLFPPPDAVVTSTAVRAVATAGLLLSVSKARCSLEERGELYLADGNVIQDIAHAALLEYRDVWIVGHNPGITTVVELITASRIEHLPPGGVARITCGDPREIYSLGELVFLDMPENCRHPLGGGSL